MVAQPIFTIPKKGSDKLCLVNDHSAGANSLNLLIPTEGGFVILDNLSDLSVTNRDTATGHVTGPFVYNHFLSLCFSSV